MYRVKRKPLLVSRGSIEMEKEKAKKRANGKT
jgi:hypothetical protein